MPMAHVTSQTKLSELRPGSAQPARAIKTGRRDSCEVFSNRSASRATTYARKCSTPHFNARLDILGSVARQGRRTEFAASTLRRSIVIRSVSAAPQKVGKQTGSHSGLQGWQPGQLESHFEFRPTSNRRGQGVLAGGL